MEKSLVNVLVNRINSFSESEVPTNLSSSETILKYYQKEEEILIKFLKPTLEAIANTDLASDEVLLEIFKELNQAVYEMRQLFQSWQLLCSKIYIILQIESLISKIQILALNIFKQLKASHQSLPNELISLSHIENCIEKINNLGLEEASSIIKEAIMEQMEEGLGPSSDLLEKLSKNLDLSSNQDFLIEVVTLEKLKDKAEQIENTTEAEFLNQLISLVTLMQERFLMLKEAKISSPVPVPSDFCCPLSLELMKDPVIVSSGQTYEREFIKNWINLGLTVCPKTRQALAHTNLIPNYTVKALISNWCELNNVKLVDPIVVSSNLEGSSSDMICNQSLDILKISQTNPEVTGVFMDLKGDSDGQDSMSTESRRESSNDFSQDSNANLNEILPQRTKGDNDDNITSQLFEHSSENKDSCRKVNSRSDLASPRPLEPRSQILNIWQQPSRNLRLVASSPVSPSGIEALVLNLAKELKSSSLETKRDATTELRLLSKHNMENRIVIANCGVILLLVDLLESNDTKIQENAVTTLLNLSINDNNKVEIANAGAIESLIRVLEAGSVEAKVNSAAALYSLSMMEENRIRIGRSGAIKPLVDLLANGTITGKKDASTALFNLSLFHENKGRIVEAGAVKHLVELMDPAAGLVEKAVAVLANLASIPEGRNAIGNEGAIHMLVDVIELGSARGKENAAATLLHICSNSTRLLNLMIHEGAIPPLVALSLSGTPRAKEKAQALLNHCRTQRQGNVIRS